MSSEARSVARYGQLYGLANLISRAAGILLLPVYVHALTAEEFGVYTILLAVMDICVLVFGAGISKAMGRYYFDHDDGDPARDRVVSTTILGFGVIFFAIIAIAYPLALAVVLVLLGSDAYAGLFGLAIITVAFTILLEIVLGYLVIRKQARAMLVLSILRFVIVIASNILFVVVRGDGLAGVIHALLLSFGILSLGITAWILRSVGLAFDMRLFGQLFAFGLPLVPSAAANSGIRLVERYFLTSFGGLLSVAIYGLADRLASLLQMFVATPFSQIFFVRRFESMAKGEDQDAFHRILLVFVALIGFFGLALAAYGAEMVSLIAPASYGNAVALLPLLALGHTLSALNLNIELGLHYRKKTWIIPVIGLASLALAVPVTFLCVRSFDAQGAATAFVIINVVRLIATVAANAHLGTPQVQLDWPRTIAILGVATALGVAAVTATTQVFTIGSLLAKTGMVVAFVVFLLFTPVLPRDTRHGILRVLGLRGAPPS